MEDIGNYFCFDFVAYGGGFDSVGSASCPNAYSLECKGRSGRLGQQSLCGLTEDQIRQQSHFPQDYFGIAHFMPEYTDGPEILALNSCRCSVREAELWAVEAYSSPEGTVTRPDIIKALNRMSSMLYILMLRNKAKER